MSTTIKTFREKCEIALAKIKDQKAFGESDEMVGSIFTAGAWLFSTPLDKMTPDTLLRTGGKLVGAFPYLGQMASRARAERDVYEQKADEIEKGLISEILAKDSKYKVTQAKSDVSAEMAEIQEFVLQKEAEKNQWEAVVEATSTMIMFIQSAIKVKEGERHMSSRMQGQ